MKLSIIVPVYNVEKFIRSCIESIFNQGLDETCFEIIIINDGTMDRSMDVISDIIESHNNIQIIEQENKGLSIARNNGLQIAKGEYIQFVDSDDLLINNTIPFLLNKAISSKADLIVADFMKLYNDEIIQFLSKPFNQKDGRSEEKSGKELFLQDLNPYYCNVWRTLYRRDFLNKNNLRFIPHICFEDILFTHQCYLKAYLCLRVNWQFIIYRKGHESITSSFNKKKGMDFCFIITELWTMSHREDFSEQIKQKIQNNDFVFFSLLLYSLTTYATFPRSEKMHILNYLKKTVPDLAFKNGIKQRIVTFLYQKVPSYYMSLRIFYAKYFQNLFWKIGDTIRNKKN